MPADQRRFLPEVRTIAGNYDLGGNLALTAFTSQAIDPAPPRAHLAGFQYGSGFLSPSL